MAFLHASLNCYEALVIIIISIKISTEKTPVNTGVFFTILFVCEQILLYNYVVLGSAT